MNTAIIQISTRQPVTTAGMQLLAICDDDLINDAFVSVGMPASKGEPIIETIQYASASPITDESIREYVANLDASVVSWSLV